MDYRLIIVTHGDSATLEETLWSFARNVRPMPTQAVMLYDGYDFDIRKAGDAPHAICDDWTLIETGRPSLGFCGAMSRAWAAAAAPGPDYVFWLEHDFTFNWTVHLDPMARILDAFPQLAQMALLRQPVSSEEIEHGGYLHIPERADMYEQQETLLRFNIDGDYVNESVNWWRHDGYWTTNPSLFKRLVCEKNAWPFVPQCEGVFGIDLKQRQPGTQFGVWGEGQPWIEHIGERTGKGY